MPVLTTAPRPFVPRDVAFDGPFLFPAMHHIPSDGWKSTPAGAAITAAMETRGLTDEHVLVLDEGDDTLAIDWHPSILGLEPMAVASDASDLDAAALGAGLDVCLAALARGDDAAGRLAARRPASRLVAGGHRHRRPHPQER